MERGKRVFRLLSVLNNEDRLKILSTLGGNPDVKITFDEFYNDVFKGKITKMDLVFHLRLLYISGLVKNDGHLENAEFSITHLGMNIISILENNKQIEEVVQV